MRRFFQQAFIVITVIAGLMVSVAAAQQTIHGTLSGSLGPGEYIVDGDIQVLAGQSLTIQPGSHFMHAGHFTWIINGQFNADGVENNPITFTRQFPYEAHKWGGFRFSENSSNQSSIQWCEIEYCKNISYPNSLGGAIFLDRVGFPIRNCKITECQAEDGGAIYANYSPAGLMIEDCYVANNNSSNGAGIYLESCAIGVAVKGCVIKDNISTGT